MMKKLVFICPFFGKLPYDQLRLCLKTCEYNKNIDWLIITNDETKYEHPENVKFIYTTLRDLKNKFQSKFDFEISLDTAYKLCDFKPTYGYVFDDLIKDYDYWGHCDPSDSIYGDLEKMINLDSMGNFDKIGFLGHMTIYRNSKEVNERFFLKSKSNVELKEILGTRDNKAFDETFNYSINAIYRDNGYPIARIDEIYSDITPRCHNFRTSLWSENFSFAGRKKESFIFEWDRGSLYKIFIKKGNVEKVEIGYIHYQKRKMEYLINIDDCNHFFVVPNKFIEIKQINKKIIKKYTRYSIKNIVCLFRIKYKILKMKLSKKFRK